MKAANKPALADAMWALMPQMSKDHQKMTMCMLLMVVHYSIEFHGRKEVHTIAVVRNTLMQYYGRAFVVFHGYDSGPSTKT